VLFDCWHRACVPSTPVALTIRQAPGNRQRVSRCRSFQFVVAGVPDGIRPNNGRNGSGEMAVVVEPVSQVADRPRAQPLRGFPRPRRRLEGRPAGRISEAARGSWGHRVVAYQMAIVLAGVSAYFSVTGLAELFPGLAVQVVVLGVALEGAKLTLVGWLSAHWRITGWQLRMAVVVLIAGLATFNASGVFARLIEGHLGVLAERTSSVSSRAGALDARIAAQAGIVGRIDARIDEIGGRDCPDDVDRQGEDGVEVRGRATPRS